MKFEVPLSNSISAPAVVSLSYFVIDRSEILTLPNLGSTNCPFNKVNKQRKKVIRVSLIMVWLKFGLSGCMLFKLMNDNSNFKTFYQNILKNFTCKSGNIFNITGYLTGVILLPVILFRGISDY